MSVSPEKQAQWDRLYAIEGPALALEVERTPGVIVAQPNRTFSSEAMDELVGQLVTWIGTRLSRAIDRGAMPKRLKVHVHVEIDGSEAQ